MVQNFLLIKLWVTCVIIDKTKKKTHKKGWVPVTRMASPRPVSDEMLAEIKVWQHPATVRYVTCVPHSHK